MVKSGAPTSIVFGVIEGVDLGVERFEEVFERMAVRVLAGDPSGKVALEFGQILLEGHDPSNRQLYTQASHPQPRAYAGQLRRAGHACARSSGGASRGATHPRRQGG